MSTIERLRVIAEAQAIRHAEEALAPLPEVDLLLELRRLVGYWQELSLRAQRITPEWSHAHQMCADDVLDLLRRYGE